MYYKCEIVDDCLSADLILYLLQNKEITTVITKEKPIGPIILPFNVIGFISNYMIDAGILYLESPFLKFKSDTEVILKPYIYGNEIIGLFLVCFYIQ